MTIEFEKPLHAETTAIPGLIVYDLPVHGDNRGWFKENWQRAKMTEAGLPDFGPVQNNISFNTKRGVTRGIHAEPWDKYISVAAGEIFGAWVDLREGPSFGKVFTCKLDPSKAIFVPRGVGNSFQTLTDNTVYTYLVNAHWSIEQKKTYTFVNLADPQLGIEWPIPLYQTERSEADLHHPYLSDAMPMPPKKTLVLGAGGQLGRAIQSYVKENGIQGFEFHDFDTFDLTNPLSYEDIKWPLYGTVINAAAFTSVNEAETPEGRKRAWQVNVTGLSTLVKKCSEHGLILIHISSDYVFDGTKELHAESESFTPLGVYGQTKAAGDALVATVPKHYIFRSSWVVGEGENFVRRVVRNLMSASASVLPKRIQAPRDQFGRLTFTEDIVNGIFYTLDHSLPFGTYNLTSEGEVASWYTIATKIASYLEKDISLVEGNSVDDYAKALNIPPRPHHCALDLSKIKDAGFAPSDWESSLSAYIDNYIERGMK